MLFFFFCYLSWAFLRIACLMGQQSVSVTIWSVTIYYLFIDHFLSNRAQNETELFGILANSCRYSFFNIRNEFKKLKSFSTIYISFILKFSFFKAFLWLRKYLPNFGIFQHIVSFATVKCYFSNELYFATCISSASLPFLVKFLWFEIYTSYDLRSRSAVHNTLNIYIWAKCWKFKI